MSETPKLTHLHLENFTAFEKLDLALSPGINVLVGENGTGKTHILKVLYSATKKSEHLGSGQTFVAEISLNMGVDLLDIFNITSDSGLIVQVLYSNDDRCDVRFCGMTVGGIANSIILNETKYDHGRYIPVKEMLVHAPGFRSLYNLREIAFEQLYMDVFDRAFLPPLRRLDDDRQRLADLLQERIGGIVVAKGEHFYLRTKTCDLDFFLVAEGIRKLAFLWLLIRNGSLSEGTVLFWDEPEANLNPRLIGTVIEVLLSLQRLGVQIFLATHSYFVLKELDLRATKDDSVAFHALYRDPVTAEIKAETTSEYIAIQHNAISDMFAEIYDRDIDKELGRRR